MTYDSLIHLQEAHAFDPVPRRFDLGVYHVPFDLITGQPTTEAVLSRSVRVPERVALIGSSGSGKTSVTSFVLGPLEEGVAPIRIPISTESTETIVSPERFAHHIVRTVADYALRASLITEGDRREAVGGATAVEAVGGGSRSTRIAATPGWVLGNAELSAELKSASDVVESQRSGAEVIAQAGRVIDVVGAAGLTPVLIIDDSDSWFQLEDDPEIEALVGGFFGPVTRMLAEELNAAVIVSVHDSYLQREGFKRAEGFIETRIRIPELPDVKGLELILAKRVAEHGIPLLEEIFASESIPKIFGYYLDGAARNLRKALLICHTALQVACSDGAPMIELGHVNTAIAEMSP